LWLPPLAEIEGGADPVSAAVNLLPTGMASFPRPGRTVRHNITHRKIDVMPVRFDPPCVDPPSDDWRWVDPTAPKVPTSSLLKKLITSCSD
jgi:hypothetical protein